MDRSAQLNATGVDGKKGPHQYPPPFDRGNPPNSGQQPSKGKHESFAGGRRRDTALYPQEELRRSVTISSLSLTSHNPPFPHRLHLPLSQGSLRACGRAQPSAKLAGARERGCAESCGPLPRCIQLPASAFPLGRKGGGRQLLSMLANPGMHVRLTPPPTSQPYPRNSRTARCSGRETERRKVAVMKQFANSSGRGRKANQS